MLKKIGYRADVACNGLEVLRALERQPYDVILMDIQMPEMDGLEAARSIRKRWPASKQPKIIAITAYAMEGDQKMCLDAGMDDYISKPVKMDELAAFSTGSRVAFSMFNGYGVSARNSFPAHQYMQSMLLSLNSHAAFHLAGMTQIHASMNLSAFLASVDHIPQAKLRAAGRDAFIALLPPPATRAPYGRFQGLLLNQTDLDTPRRSLRWFSSAMRYRS